MAAGVACGIKASGDPDLSLVATDDGRPVAAAAVFTANKATAGPVNVSRAHLAATGGPGRGRGPQQRLRQRRHRRHRATPTPSGCAPWSPASLGCAADEVLVCSTGLIGYHLPMAAVESGIPALVAARRPDGGPAAAQRHHDHRHRPQGGLGHGDGYTVGGMAKGAAMLAPDMATMLAVLTTDAVADPDQLLRAAAGGGGRLVQPPRGRRLHVHQRHRDRAGQRPVGPAPRSTSVLGRGLRRAGRADGGRRRGGHQAGPDPGPRGRVRRRRPPGRPQGGREPAGPVLAVTAPTPTGAGSSASWAARAPPSTPTGSRSPTAAWWCAGTGSRPTTTWPRWRPTWPAATSRSPPTWAWATGRAAMLFTDLTPAYIDENMGTS